MAKSKGRRDSKDDDPKGSGTPRLLKWVGAVTAVLSLGFAVQKAVQMVSDGRERQRQITELTSTAVQQQSTGDYKAAWATFQRADEVAEPTGQLARLTGQLSNERRQIRSSQEDLAMTWLENVRVKSLEGETFASVIEPLDPVLNRGVVSSSGARKADLLAHVGWATFLKWRDGDRRVDPDRQYEEALAVDPANPYANAYRAHWLLWTRREAALPEAKALFSTALASGRVKDHVRRIQLSALKNMGSDGEAEYIAAVNDMRMKGERIDPATRHDYYGIYSFACALRHDTERLERFARAVPIAEQVVTFQALFFGTDKEAHEGPGADACLAVLLEAAGRSQEALRVWEGLAGRFPPRDGNRLGDRAREAQTRLRRQRAS